MRRMLWLLFTLLLAVMPALGAAAEPAEAPVEPDAFTRIDDAFGAYLVGPMATVMFFDLAFWDNTLPQGEIPAGPDGGAYMVGDEELTGHSDAGYIYQRRWTAPVAELTRELPAGGVQVAVDGLNLTVSRGADGLVGALAETPLPLAPCADFETCGVALAEFAGATTSGDGLRLTGSTGVVAYASPAPLEGARVLSNVARFPLLVVQDGDALRALAATVPVSADLVPVEVGNRVEHNGSVAMVLSIDGGEAALRGVEKRSEASTLKNPADVAIPLVVAWLVVGAVFFTVRMNFINLRGFAHAIVVTRGVYDNPDDPGEISHFKALSSALSATVGLGNIAGVAIAVAVGGPGAIPWMVIAGFLGMSSKFTECTLGQMYRTVDSKGQVSGGPMHYLQKGLADMGLAVPGRVLSIIFAVMCIGGSLGGGNMFQANQSFAAVAEVVPLFDGRAWLYGILLSISVGIVILGGIKRIGAAAGLIVPVMCGVYVIAAGWILLVHAADIPTAFGVMFDGAFSTEAGLGGLLGALIQGFRRAAFSNEAGVGSASIAHSAAATDEPVREGIVALLEPFIDTIVVCTMTGLVVVITGAYTQPTGDGVLMTSAAFGSVLSWFPLVLSFAVVMFAYSTMISWSYYGERCATFLFGPKASLPYKLVFLACVFFGSVLKLGNVLDFSDLMILGMAFPNILGLFLLSGKVKKALDNYWGRLQSGEMKRHA